MSYLQLPFNKNTNRKKNPSCYWLLLVSSIFFPLTVSAVDDEVCFYTDINFKGNKKCHQISNLVINQPSIELANDNQFSSVSFPDEGYKIEVFEDADYNGRSLAFYRGATDFEFTPFGPRNHKALNFNNLISSYKITPLEIGAKEQVCIFQHWNYSGKRKCWDMPESGKTITVEVPPELNVSVSSLTVPPAARVKMFDASSQNGNSYQLDNDNINFKDFGWNDIIASLTIENLLGRQLLTNGDGSDVELSGWTTSSACWSNNKGEFTATSAHTDCVRWQEIDLLKEGFSSTILARQPTIAISEVIKRTKACVGDANVKIELLDKDKKTIQTWSSDVFKGVCANNSFSGNNKHLTHAFNNYGTNLRYIKWTESVQNALSSDVKFDNAQLQLLSYNTLPNDVNLFPGKKTISTAWEVDQELEYHATASSEFYLSNSHSKNLGINYPIDFWKQGIAGEAIIKGLLKIQMEYKLCTDNDNVATLRYITFDERDVYINERVEQIKSSCGQWTKKQMVIPGNFSNVRKAQIKLMMHKGLLEVRDFSVSMLGNNLLDLDMSSSAWQVSGQWSMNDINGPSNVLSNGNVTRTQTIDLLANGVSPLLLSGENKPEIVIHETYVKTKNQDSVVTLKIDLLDENKSQFATWSASSKNQKIFNKIKEIGDFKHTFKDYGDKLRYIRWTETGHSGILFVGSFVGLNYDNAANQKHRRVVRETSICGLPGQRPCHINSEHKCSTSWFSLSPCIAPLPAPNYCLPGSELKNGLCWEVAIECCSNVDYSYGRELRVSGGRIARIYLPAVDTIVPKQDPAICPGGHREHVNTLASVVENTEHTSEYNSTWWGTTYPNLGLMINANFYDIGNPPANRHHPYIEKCTKALGLVMSDGVVVNPVGKAHNRTTDSLIIFNESVARKSGIYADIVSDTGSYRGKIEDAVSGFILLKNGKYVPNPRDINPKHHLPRTVVGINKSKDRLIVVVINPGDNNEGIPLRALSRYMLSLGADIALNLDGSGSSQLFGINDKGLEVRSLPSDKIDSLPKPHKPVYGGPYYRPVPVFLGFKKKVRKGREYSEFKK